MRRVAPTIGVAEIPRGLLISLPPRFWLLVSLRRACPRAVAAAEPWTYLVPGAGAARRVGEWIAAVDLDLIAEARRRAWTEADAARRSSSSAGCRPARSSWSRPESRASPAATSSPPPDGPCGPRSPNAPSAAATSSRAATACSGRIGRRPGVRPSRRSRMQQRSDAARKALRIVKSGRTVPPARFNALRQAGLVDVRGRGGKARWWVTDEGERFLADAEA